MNPSREEALFALALEKPVDKRPAFLDAVCEGDSALRQRLEALLAAHHAQDSFLEPEAPKPRSQPVKTIKVGVTDSPADDAVGRMVGHYKLLEKSAKAVAAWSIWPNKPRPCAAGSPSRSSSWAWTPRRSSPGSRRSARPWRMMDHPNIAKRARRGRDGHRPALLRHGTGPRDTDHRLLRPEHLSTEERLELFVQVCHAIQHAHQKGIIHRDIKPSNILVMLADDVPVPKVIDFGIAKAIGERLTDKTVFTQFEQFIGTPAYTSPEQAGVSGLDVDTRSDIYSLGVLLYELLTGRTPFETKALAQAGLEEISPFASGRTSRPSLRPG